MCGHLYVLCSFPNTSIDYIVEGWKNTNPLLCNTIQAYLDQASTFSVFQPLELELLNCRKWGRPDFGCIPRSV